MISIEAWRMSIGSHNKKNVNDLSTLTRSKTNIKTCGALMMTLIIIASSLICVLLVRGGIESNPGPKNGNKDVK